jgi:hypothetical protein
MKWALSMIAGLLLAGQTVQAGVVDVLGRSAPIKHQYTARAKQTMSYTITFKGGEIAKLALVGSGTTDIDIFVFDQNGNLIKKGVGGGDRWLATWTPRWTGKFTIIVANRGDVANQFALATN